MSAKKKKTRRVYSKKKALKKTTARRGTLILTGIVLAGGLLMGGYLVLNYVGDLFFSKNPHFEIKKVFISSDGRLKPSQLMRYAELDQTENLFEVDFDRVRTHLKRSPLIESVRIQRDLPDTLNISVVERVAIAQIRWKRRSAPLLVDRTGKVLPPTRTGMALPMIEGVTYNRLSPGDQIDDAGVLYVLDLFSANESLELGSQVAFKRFDLRYPDYINVELVGGENARFPRHSAHSRLVRLVATLQGAQVRGKRVKTVDLVPEGLNTPVVEY